MNVCNCEQLFAALYLARLTTLGRIGTGILVLFKGRKKLAATVTAYMRIRQTS